jgi:hypothetical protein
MIEYLFLRYRIGRLAIIMDHLGEEEHLLGRLRLLGHDILG